MKLLQIITLFLAAVLGAVLPLSVHAKDTDIYLKTSTGLSTTRDDAPNVLIILDNSGSMEISSITGKPPYDPATNYCANTVAGRPAGNVCDTTSNQPYDRVFWSFSKLSTPPAATAATWFDSAKNMCIDSKESLGNTGVGYYPAEKIARWCSKDTCGNPDANWKSFKKSTSVSYANADIQYVDCKADNKNLTTNSVADGQASDDAYVPQNDTTAAYTTSGNSTAFNWDSYSTDAKPTLISANYLAYVLNATLATTSRTRMAIAKDAVKEMIDAFRNIRLGLMVFNNNDSTTGPHGGRVVMKVDNMTDARRTTMKAIVSGICGYHICDTNTANTNPYEPNTSSGYIYTPLGETLWEAYRYLAGISVTYGDDMATPLPPRDTSADTGGNYITPFKYGCQDSHVIILTDGDPILDGHADTEIKTLTGATCTSYNGTNLGTAGTQAPNSCMKDLAKWMYKNDVVPESTLKGTQNVITHTVGFGSGISAGGLSLLQTTAANGGGQYKTANSAADLADALQILIEDATQQITSFSAPSLSINAFNRLYNRDEIYFALFKPSVTRRWDGNIKKYHLCNTVDVTTYGCTFGDILDGATPTPQQAIDNKSRIKETATSYWSSSADGSDVVKGGAGDKIPVPASRKLYTHGAFNGQPAALTEVVVDASNNFYKDMVADPTKLGLPTGSVAADVNKVIQWMRGDIDGTTSTRDRWVMGDPLHSRPVAITFGKNTTDGKAIVKLFVGANDGTVRMINDDSGVEEWAFIPNNPDILSAQNNLMLDTIGDHFFGMDATPSFWVQDKNGDGIVDPATGEKVYMYIGMRRGGSNIYAFDVTPSPGKVTSSSDTTNTISPKLLWTITGGSGDFTKLGQTWSRPLVSTILVKGAGAGESKRETVLLFGGGYSTSQDNNIPAGTDSVGNAIYMVNPSTGARIWWASSDAAANLVIAGMDYSIPSDLAIMDSNADGAVDRIYVGDTGGQVWRVDLGNQINFSGGSTTGGSGAHKFASLASTSEQHKRKFFYPPDIAQIKDTEYSSAQYYDMVTIGSGDREDPLDILTTNLVSPKSKEAVHNRIYALRDYSYQTGPAASPSTITQSDLYNVDDNKLGTYTGLLLDAQIDDFKTKKGWFLRLKESVDVTLPNGLTTSWIGEKVLSRTVIFNGILYVTTYTPANDLNSTDACVPDEGIAAQFALNLLTATGAADFDNDGQEDDRKKVIGGGIPSETVVIIREGGTTGLIGTSGGAASAEGDFSNKAARTFWYEE